MIHLQQKILGTFAPPKKIVQKEKDKEKSDTFAKVLKKEYASH